MKIKRSYARSFPRYIAMAAQMPVETDFDLEIYREIQTGDPVDVDDTIGEVLCDRGWTIQSADFDKVNIEYKKSEIEEA